MKVLGFMTGTSLDGVDMAVLETDGEEILELGPAGSKPQDEEVQAHIDGAATGDDLGSASAVRGIWRR